MQNYKKMYLKLFNEVTDTIARLKEIQKECEKIFIEDDDNNESGEAKE